MSFCCSQGKGWTSGTRGRRREATLPTTTLATTPARATTSLRKMSPYSPRWGCRWRHELWSEFVRHRLVFRWISIASRCRGRAFFRRAKVTWTRQGSTTTTTWLTLYLLKTSNQWLRSIIGICQRICKTSSHISYLSNMFMYYMYIPVLYVCIYMYSLTIP